MQRPRRPSAVTALWGALACLVALAAVGFGAAFSDTVQAIDASAAAGFVAAAPSGLGVFTSRVARLCDEGPYMLIGLAIVGVALLRGRIARAGAVAVLLVVTGLTTQTLKSTLGHPRAGRDPRRRHGLLAQRPLDGGDDARAVRGPRRAARAAWRRRGRRRGVRAGGRVRRARHAVAPRDRRRRRLPRGHRLDARRGRRADGRRAAGSRRHVRGDAPLGVDRRRGGHRHRGRAAALRRRGDVRARAHAGPRRPPRGCACSPPPSRRRSRRRYAARPGSNCTAWQTTPGPGSSSRTPSVCTGCSSSAWTPVQPISRASPLTATVPAPSRTAHTAPAS